MSKPLLTVDAVLFDSMGRVLLIQRMHDPFKDCWALPGGFVENGETVEEAVVRELTEETGEVWNGEESIQLLRLYSEPGRDPRGSIISAAFVGIVEAPPALKAGSDARKAEWHLNWELIPLAFDHAKIIEDAWESLGIRRGPVRSQSDTATAKQLTPAQNRALRRLYAGQAGTFYQPVFYSLQQRGLIEKQSTHDGRSVYTITQRGVEAIS